MFVKSILGDPSEVDLRVIRNVVSSRKEPVKLSDTSRTILEKSDSLIDLTKKANQVQVFKATDIKVMDKFSKNIANINDLHFGSIKAVTGLCIAVSEFQVYSEDVVKELDVIIGAADDGKIDLNPSMKKAIEEVRTEYSSYDLELQNNLENYLEHTAADMALESFSDKALVHFSAYLSGHGYAPLGSAVSSVALGIGASALIYNMNQLYANLAESTRSYELSLELFDLEKNARERLKSSQVIDEKDISLLKASHELKGLSLANALTKEADAMDCCIIGNIKDTSIFKGSIFTEGKLSKKKMALRYSANSVLSQSQDWKRNKDLLIKHIGQGPDLVVTKIWFSKNNPVAGAPVNIIFTVTNSGSSAAGMRKDYLTIDGSRVTEFDSSSLPSGVLSPGESQNWKYLYHGPTGEHLVEVVADGANQVQEWNERNNGLAEMLCVMDGESNTPPFLESLTPDRSSPQRAGTSITWKATARDLDEDPILYEFQLMSPATGNFWKDMTGWTTSDTWTWETTSDEIGMANQVLVEVRDGFHSGPGNYDDYYISRDYTLTEGHVQSSGASKLDPATIEYISERKISLALDDFISSIELYLGFVGLLLQLSGDAQTVPTQFSYHLDGAKFCLSQEEARGFMAEKGISEQYIQDALEEVSSLGLEKLGFSIVIVDYTYTEDGEVHTDRSPVICNELGDPSWDSWQFYEQNYGLLENLLQGYDDE
jgi:hypothetical protein